jgi:hypothetical protein
MTYALFAERAALHIGLWIVENATATLVSMMTTLNNVRYITLAYFTSALSLYLQNL